MATPLELVLALPTVVPFSLKVIDLPFTGEFPAVNVAERPVVPPYAPLAVTGDTVVSEWPACVIDTVCPAIVIVVLREPFAGDFDPTENVTEPLPLPLAPAVTVSQLVSLLTAVQAHPPGLVTLTVPAPAE